MREYLSKVGKNTKMKKRALFIYNPYCGRKKKHRRFPVLLNQLSNIGYIIDLQQTTDPIKNEYKIREACNKKWEAIFIAGGDGTLNKVIQSLAVEEYRPVMGIFPFGTSNEFAKFAGIPVDVFHALSVIEGQHTKPVDIGKFGDHYFINIAAAGWMADVIHETPHYLKYYLGEFAYYLFFLKKLLTKKHSDSISIDLSPETTISDVFFFMIMNGNSVGPFKQLIPNANLSDGFFHLITCKKTNGLLFLYNLIVFMLHGSDRFSLFSHMKIKESIITLSEHMTLNMDGEKSEQTHQKFEVFPQHLRIFAPTNYHL